MLNKPLMKMSIKDLNEWCQLHNKSVRLINNKGKRYYVIPIKEEYYTGNKWRN